VYVYVSFRSPHPKKATMDRALKKLQENNIDVKNLVKYRPNRCYAGRIVNRGRKLLI